MNEVSEWVVALVSGFISSLTHTRYIITCFHTCQKPKIGVNVLDQKHVLLYLFDTSVLHFFFVSVHNKCEYNIKFWSYYISWVFLQRGKYLKWVLYYGQFSLETSNFNLYHFGYPTSIWFHGEGTKSFQGGI